MASIGAGSASHRGAPQRLMVLAILLLGAGLMTSYLLYVPMMQIYWGVYARVNPMRSESDGSQRGQATPGATQVATAKPVDHAGIYAAKLAAQVAAEGQAAAGGKAAHSLTKELVSEVAKGGPIVVTWANYHYRDFVMNWVERLKATGCTSYIVGAMDDELLQVLIDAKVPTFAMSSGLTTGDFGWGTATFHKMGRQKISLVQAFTAMGQDVLISDVDTVWMRNPLEYVAKYPEADILTSSDHLHATATDGGLEYWDKAGSAANIGIMLFRVKASALADEWVQILDADEKVWDQNAFNDLFRRGQKGIPDRQDRLFLGYGGTLKIGILPVSLFCSGHTFFTQDMPAKLKMEAYVAHATFQYSGTPGKRNRFRERLLWSDPPEYFKAAPGYISVAVPDLGALKEAARTFDRDGSLEATMPHFALVNRQLTTVRTLFALSATLDRSAVLPRLWCGQDRWWSPHSGIIPGSDLDLPYLCPADHVLDLEKMESMEETKGRWREYSFLENTRAAHLRDSTLTVVTCKGDEPGCSDGTAAAMVEGGKVRLKAGLKDKAIATALKESTAGHAVLHFEDPESLWGGFAEGESAIKFKKRMDALTSIWCCVNKHPGHIWYDMFWDQGPHKDKHNREIGQVWAPLTGP